MLAALTAKGFGHLCQEHMALDHLLKQGTEPLLGFASDLTRKIVLLNQETD